MTRAGHTRKGQVCVRSHRGASVAVSRSLAPWQGSEVEREWKRKKRASEERGRARVGPASVERCWASERACGGGGDDWCRGRTVGRRSDRGVWRSEKFASGVLGWWAGWLVVDIQRGHATDSAGGFLVGRGLLPRRRGTTRGTKRDRVKSNVWPGKPGRSAAK